MATNHYFRNSQPEFAGEQSVTEQLVIESIKIHGLDMVYIPRTHENIDMLFGEDRQPLFNEGVGMLEMYISNVDGFSGQGDLFGKFGLNIKDSADFVVSKERFRQEIPLERPQSGDLIYLPLTRSLFEIKAVEHENPFYQLGRLYVYTLKCELHEYNQDDLETGIPEIDDIERNRAASVTLYLDPETWNEEIFHQGELVFQGATFINDAPIRAEVVIFDPVQMLLVVNNVVGLFQAGEVLIEARDISGARAVVTTIGDMLPTNPLADNTQIEGEANNIISDPEGGLLEFTPDDPFGGN